MQDAFLKLLPQSAHVIAFGSQKQMTYEDVKKILTENKPENLIEIMHMHFKCQFYEQSKESQNQKIN